MRGKFLFALGIAYLATAPSGCSDQRGGVLTAPVAAPQSGPSTDALKSETYSEYPSTAAFYADTGAGKKFITIHGELFAIDTAVTYKGHQTLRYNQPGGNDLTPQMEVDLPSSLSKVWVRAKIRWSPGYTTTGTLTNSSNAYKIMGWGWTSGYDGRGTFDLTNTVQYQTSWDVRRSSDGTAIGPFAWGYAGSVAQEWTDGGWYDYIVCFEKVSPTQTRTRIWVAPDGQTPVLRTTAIGTVTSSDTAPDVNRIHFGQNFNQVRAATQTQALWYGQWEIVDGGQHGNPFDLSDTSVVATASDTSGTKASTTGDTSTTTSSSTTSSTSSADTAHTVSKAVPSTYVSLDSETFSEYADINAFYADTGIGKKYITVNGDLFQLDQSVKYDGHQTMKYYQPAGQKRSPQLEVPLFPAVSKIWIRAKVRWSTGYTTAGADPTQNGGYTLLSWGWTSGWDGSGSLSLTNTDLYGAAWDVRSSVTGQAGGAYAWNSGGKIAQEWTDGAWYDYIVCFEKTSATTTRTRIWIAKDGETPVLRSTVEGSMNASAGSAPDVNRIHFGEDFNAVRGANQDQALWLGKWEIVDGSKYADPYKLN